MAGFANEKTSHSAIHAASFSTCTAWANTDAV
jgi:hypothetical protein